MAADTHDTLPRSMPGRQGFTLMEILLAVAILGIVFATVYGAWASVSGASRQVSADSERNEAAEICLNRMIADLQGFYVPQRPEYAPPESGGDPDPYRIVAAGESGTTPAFPSLRFASRSHLPLAGAAPGGMARIAYYLDSASGRPPYVIRRADALLPGETLEPSGADPILCENVQQLSFTFVDAEGNTREQWDSDDTAFGYGTPAAVAIHLEIGDGEMVTTFQTAVDLSVVRAPQE